MVVLIVGLILSLCFGGALLFGAPYVPTLNSQMKTALALLELRPGQTLLEIGSGDGKVLLAAAKQGIKAYGYEINPILVLVSRWRTRKYRTLVTVVWGDAWAKRWPPTDGIYVFGLDRLMGKLHTKIVQSIDKPVRITSIGFAMKSAELVAQDNGVFLYEVQPKA